MPKTKNATDSKKSPEIDVLNAKIDAVAAKLDAVAAILLRQLNDEAIEKWQKQDKPNTVQMLINVGLSNEQIANMVGFTKGSVANTRSKYEKEKKNRRKKKTR